MTEAQKVKKKIFTAAEFEKCVQIETINLIYFDRLNPSETVAEVKKYVGSKFQVS